MCLVPSSLVTAFRFALLLPYGFAGSRQKRYGLFGQALMLAGHGQFRSWSKVYLFLSSPTPNPQWERFRDMTTNAVLIARVETMAKEPRILAIAREYDDILEDIGNVEATAEMIAMVMIALERVSAMGQSK